MPTYGERKKVVNAKSIIPLQGYNFSSKADRLIPNKNLDLSKTVDIN